MSTSTSFFNTYYGQKETEDEMTHINQGRYGLSSYNNTDALADFQTARILRNEYYEQNETKDELTRIDKEKYSLHSYSKTDALTDLQIDRILPQGVDIFSSLPTYVFNNKHAKLFLVEMKRCLLNWNEEELYSISLPKLQVSEHTETTLVIEWIFNYFRSYFAFYKDEGDFYGSVMKKDETLSNIVKEMKIKDFQLIAEAEVTYAIIMAGGVKGGNS